MVKINFLSTNKKEEDEFYSFGLQLLIFKRLRTFAGINWRLRKSLLKIQKYGIVDAIFPNNNQNIIERDMIRQLSRD